MAIQKHKISSEINRITALLVITAIFGVMIFCKLFYLQIIRHGEYKALAEQQHWSTVFIPATRGEILVRDSRSGELFPLATNLTNYLLYLDPLLLKKENISNQVVDSLAPLLLDKWLESKKSETTDQEDKQEKPTDWLSEYKKDLFFQIEQRQDTRYLPLFSDLPAEFADKIAALNLRGVALIPQPRRFYPEGSLAANVLGFVNHDRYGQYGIEEQYEYQLAGRSGEIKMERDLRGRDIALGDSFIKPAEDGEDIILTIDRAVQAEAEKILDNAVKTSDATSGQVIVLEPETARVIAMANYPTFDPNNYGENFAMEPRSAAQIKSSQSWLIERNHKYPVIVENEDGKKEEVYNYRDLLIPQAKEGEDVPQWPKFYLYQNRYGPGVFQNKAVSDIYEPGSIFKGLVMAAAIDAKEVTPNTTSFADGPVKIDEYWIHNSEDKYYGRENMTEVLEHSSNMGMVFVSKRLGKKLMYRYMLDFGFTRRSDVGLDNEEIGSLKHYDTWSDVELATVAFGQGVAVTPIQMATAFNAIANGGKLMRPYIIEKRLRNGEVVEENTPQIVKQVITPKAAATVASMLVSVVENGHGKRAGVTGYYVAGKTGTAQIAKGGGYEKGQGTTIGSFVGFAPLQNPRFTILVKMDRPRGVEWGEATAAPVFGELAKFLFKYYDVPPTRK